MDRSPDAPGEDPRQAFVDRRFIRGEFQKKPVRRLRGEQDRESEEAKEGSSGRHHARA